MKRILPAALLAIALLAGGGWWISQQGNTSRTAFDLPGAAVAQETGADIEVVEMVLGAEDAPVEVIEYASFTCPHCGAFHNEVLPDIKANYVDTGKVRFVYREVYFDKYGMWASLIARCEPTKFFGITDLLYKGQSTWTRAGSDAAIADALRKVGRLAGIEQEQLDVCLSDGDKLRALVEWYRANAEEHGISSTPSFVVDGQTYSNMSYAEFAALLDEKAGQ